MRWYRAGFTLPEVLITMTIMTVTTGMVVPQVHQILEREAVRGAKLTLATHIARARGVAASRGCHGVMHVFGGSDSRVWVTSCSLSSAGVDTVGMVDGLSDRYGVSITTSTDSITFSPIGLAISGWFEAEFTKGETVDSLAVSAIGRKLW